MESPRRQEALAGRKQVSILRTVHGGRWFDCGERNGLYRACLRLEARRLLRRDPRSARRFTSTPAGEALIEARDGRIADTIGGVT